MATLFVDYEGGNDNYGGTSFALKASGADGAITSSTFSSATASFPNDGSLIGQYLSIFNGTIYAVYNITAWVSSTSLTIAQITGGTALANTSARQYYIGGRWQTLTNGATAVRINAGDTLRLMGSPAPTSLGITGTWTSERLVGTTNISAATNATPIAITSTAHGLSTGDTVVITAVAGNTAANGTWEVTVTNANAFTLDGSVGNGAYTSGGTVRKRNNTRVKLTSALTQTIASTGNRTATWTASANVTTSLDTTNVKEHQYSDSIAIAAAFTTGKAAFYATGTLDLSGYQQVSFWIRQSAGTIGAIGAVSLNLCSDVNGNTTVNTINIPVVSGGSVWMPVTVDTGAALGSSIRSIALYVNTDNGAQTFQINNIIACKASSAADSLTLTSLISKNRADDTWYAIQSISGTRVMLDNWPSVSPAAAGLRGYSHSSGTQTVTTWKRETIKTALLTGSTGLFNINENGTAGNLIYFEGGWDRTSMSTQNIETWFDGQNGLGYATIEAASYTSFNKFSFVRYTSGPQYRYSFNTITNAHYNNMQLYGLYCAATYCTIDTVFVSGCGNNNVFGTGARGTTINNLNTFGAAGVGLTNQGGAGPGVTITNSTIRNNNNNGVNVGGWNLVFNSCTAVDNNGNGFMINSFNNGGNSACIQCTSINNSSSGFYGGSNNSYLVNCTSSGNGTAVGASTSSPVFAKNCSFSEATVFNIVAQTNARLYSQNESSISGNNKIYTDYGLIIADTVNRHTASGFSWKLSPTSTIRDAIYPLDFSLAKIAVAANSLVTVKAWMYRDNSGLTMQLVCKGGQIAGVPSDVVSTVSATGAWEEETIAFTPTEQGVVEIIAQAYGGSTFNGWVDDMTITQA